VSKITALVVQKRNKDRVNVYLDGKFGFSLTMLEAFKLKKGQTISDQDLIRLKVQDEKEVAHERVLKFLSYRPRSVAEVRRKLSEKRISEAIIDEEIDRLMQAQLIDDRAFASYWLENRNQFGPRSTRALRFELRKKGVADADISSVLENFDEIEAAYEAAKRQLRRFTRLDARTFQKKIGDFLVRRGFSYSIAKDVIKRLWAEHDSNLNDALNADWEEE